MRNRELKTPGIGGLDLFAQSWLPENSPRALLVLSHGLGEHSGRYAALAGELVGQGYGVYALDHRGHGRSPGPRGNVERFAHLVSDLCVFVGRCGRQHLDTPVYLLGHSMGGAVAFASALRLQDSLRGLVLSAPALTPGDAASPLREFAVRTLAAVAPGAGVLALPPSDISRDPEIVAAYERDPLVLHKSVPARTVVELLDAMRGFPAQAPRLLLPTLILHGSGDRLVSLATNRPVYQAIGARERSLKVYEGLYHEVFNEPERATVIGDLLRWLES
jgi:alpha-beta hydrolase superfamily lysophospholipase